MHDVEIASTSREAKKRSERPDVDDKKGGKPAGKRGVSRSLLTKTKPKREEDVYYVNQQNITFVHTTWISMVHIL